jgi:hypothetical protein
MTQFIAEDVSDLDSPDWGLDGNTLTKKTKNSLRAN